jgi:signal transduction histidine kinase
MKTTVLLVEDNPGDTRLVEEMLDNSGTNSYDITHLESLSAALDQLSEARPDIILLDLNLPDSHGAETFDSVAEHDIDAPVVVLTGLDDEQLGLQLVQQGAQDYLVKGELSPMLLKKSIVYAIERHESKQRMQQVADALRLINKLIRHDVINRLQIAQSALDLAGEGTKKDADDAMLHKAIDRVRDTIALLQRMRDLEQLVASSKNLQRYDARQVAEEVAAQFDVSITLEGDCVVTADKALYSVLENLLRNAVDHGGSTKIHISMCKDDSTCKVRIADNGSGIDDEIKQRVFNEEFSSGGSAGSGLGLYIVKKTMERYGGSVAIEDNHPRGTVVVLTFKGGMKA